MSCRSNDGDGALVLFGIILGICSMLLLLWLFSLDGKSINKDTKINVCGKQYRIINYKIDDNRMIIDINKLGD